MTTSVDTVVRQWTDAINRHDVDAVLDHVAEDCVFVNIGDGHRADGRSAFREEFVALFDRSPDVHFETTRMLVDGSHYCKVWVMTATGPGGGALRVHGVGVGEVRDGRIASATEFWNPAEMLEQVPAPQ